MNTKTTIVAALVGSMVCAGAALAAGAGDASLVTAAKEGDRAAVQSLVNGQAKRAVAGAEGTAALVWPHAVVCHARCQRTPHLPLLDRNSIALHRLPHN